MNTLGLTYDDLRSAARILSKHAAAIESHLYMNMTTAEAHAAIDEAERLAEIINEAADNLDTDIPEDSG